MLEAVTREFRRQGWGTDVARTEGPRHAEELATRAVRAGARHVIVVGGDGTVHEAANGLLRAAGDAVLGVVPAGSGNDFAKLVGVFRHSPAQAVRRLVTAATASFDVGSALGEYFVNSMGFGFGPAVVRARERLRRLGGALSYLVPVLRTFAGFRPPRFAVTAPGFAETGPLMMVELCNGTTAGGSYRVAPAADPGDGQLDVCLVRRVSLPRFLLAVPRVMRGTHTAMREVALFRASEVAIRGLDGPLVAHVDGELREPGVWECTVRVERRRLAVLAAR